MRLLLALLGLAAAPILAHRVPPEAIVSELNASRSRAEWGVERAERDPKAPRLLVIRVGERWYARSDTPAVHFGRGGAVRSLHDRGVVPP